MNTLDSARHVRELVWVKSSYSAGNGGDCVEVAWRRSSYSSGEGGQCVEVAQTVGVVHVRDSKRATGQVLTVAPAEWTAFLRMAAGRD